MTIKEKENAINSYLQKALLLSLKYRSQPEIGKLILATASKMASVELALLRFVGICQSQLLILLYLLYCKNLFKASKFFI